jgi:hypothetical protein
MQRKPSSPVNPALLNRAQRTADETGEPLVILNLNAYHPLYVIRAATEANLKCREYVETIYPRLPDNPDAPSSR